MTKPTNPDILKKIMDVVKELIKSKGLDAVSMRTVGELAGITPTTIYYYFKDKSEMIEAVKQDALSQLDQFVEKAIDTNLSFALQLKSLISSFINWSLQNQTLAELIFEKLHEHIELTDDLVKLYYKTQLRAADILERGQQNGEFKFKDSNLEAALIFAWLQGVIISFFDKRLPPDFWDHPQPLVDRFFEIYIDNNLKIKKTEEQRRDISETKYINKDNF